MTTVLTPDARARLDAHLDAVEGVLAAAGRTREQRRAVVDDLEPQVLDMLAARSAAPTAEEVEAVLAGLDAPAAYGAAAEMGGTRSDTQPAAGPRLPRTLMAGMMCLLASVALQVCGVAVAYFAVAPVGRPPQPAEPLRLSWIGMGMLTCVASVPVLLGLVGTVLGWVAFAQIRASGGRLHGRGLAMATGLALPVGVVAILLLLA